LTQLTKLYLSDNPIQDMEPLSKLIKQLPDLEMNIEVTRANK
jgi:Leucine-rich repeat (LRR) protein